MIEDDRSTIDFYKEVFVNLAGYDLEVIEWCQKAIDALKEIREGKREKWDLVLLDIILPDMNGIYFLIEARKYPQTKDLKIFALTNYVDPKTDEQLLKEGIDKILVKTNYTPRQLINLINETLNQKKKNKKLHF